MRRTLLLLAALLALAAPAAAQFTQVSGTITDPSGIPYSNAVVSIRLVPTTSSPTLNGQSCCGSTAASTNAAGAFIVQLADNNVVLPAGTQWEFTVSIAPGIPSPLGTGPQSFTVAPITITGATQSVSAALTAAAPALTNFAGGGAPGGLVGDFQVNAGAGLFGGVTPTGAATDCLLGTSVFGACPVTTPAAGANTLQYNNVGAFGSTTGVTYVAALQMLSQQGIQLSESVVVGVPGAGLHWLSVDSTSFKLTCTDPGATSCMPFVGTAGNPALRFRAGAAGAVGAPAYFQAGSLMGAAEAHALEWDGTDPYVTTSAAERHRVLAYLETALLTGDTQKYNGTKWVNSYVGTVTRADNDGTVALVTGDKDTLVTAGHAAANAVSIAQAGTAGFPLSWTVNFCTTGAGLSTITPTTSTIWNGSTDAATLTLANGDCATIFVSDTAGNGKYFSVIKRAVPTRTTGTTNFLREDNTYAAPTGGGGPYTINGGTNVAYSVSPEYVPLFNSSPSPTVTEVQVASRFAQTVTSFSKMYARLSVVIAGGSSVTFTLMKNGAAQSLTCTVAAAGQDCSDLVNTVAVAANDLISMRITYTGTPGSTAQFWSILVTP